MGVCMSAPVEPTNTALWEDRQIKWDIPMNQTAPRKGEKVIQVFEGVEDTKHSSNKKCNISIGLGNVNYIHINMLTSKSYGRLRAPYIMTQFKGSRFEFTFSATNQDENMKLFGLISKHHRGYRATRVYRDLVLRDEMLLKEGELNVLPQENILRTVEPCENLTVDSSFAGKMFITNFRVVWAANEPNNVNVSVPYLQMKNVTSRTSTKHGMALVLETSEASGGYTLGFKLGGEPEVQELITYITQQLLAARKDIYLGPTDANVRVENDRLIIVPPPSPQEEEAETRRHAETVSRPENILAAHTSRNNTQAETRDNMVRLMGQAASAAEAQPGVSLPPGAVPREGLANVTNAPTPQQLEDSVAPVRPSAMSPQSRKYAEKGMTCVVCWSAKTNAAFDPCGHMSTCTDCAAKLEECPICRVKIDKFIKIFMVGN